MAKFESFAYTSLLQFSAKGLIIEDPGYLEVYTYDTWSNKVGRVWSAEA